MIEIIPAIDIIDGKCVRLEQGNYMRKKIYSENPLEVAKSFEDAGIKRLHLVDLDGAKQGRVINYKILENIAAYTHLTIDFGGGIKTDDDIKIIFESGADMVSIGTVAVKNKPLFASWLKKYGSDKIILGADVKNEKISISGWEENTDISVFAFINENLNLGIKKLLCTDISKDGILEGPSFDLYKKITLRFPDLYLLASGGVASINDVEQLEIIGCNGVIIGKAIYEGKINLWNLKK